MTIICNVTGNERKRLAQVLGAYLLWEPVYTKAPTFAYVVNNYVIDKFGTIACPDSATPEDVEQIVAHLTAEGFSPEISEDTTADVGPDEDASAPEASAPEAQPDGEAESPAEGEDAPDVAEENAPAEEASPDKVSDDDTRLTISVPRSKVPVDVLGRLKSIIANKEVLFKRALQTDALPIETTDEEVSFPWFTLTGIDGEGEAYAQFITHLVKMADEQTRVLDKPYDGDNDRFAMRIFMVRMGMKGDKFALARKLMMKHLTGNSGWRYGAPPKRTDAPDEPTPAEETPVEEAPATAPDEAASVPEAPAPEIPPQDEAESAADGAETPNVAAPEEGKSAEAEETLSPEPDTEEEAPEDAPDTGDDPDDDFEEADTCEE